MVSYCVCLHILKCRQRWQTQLGEGDSGEILQWLFVGISYTLCGKGKTGKMIFKDILKT